MTAGTDYIIRAAEGLVLLSAAFVTSLSTDAAALCIRAEGVRLLHNGSQTSRQMNDLAPALDAFDGLFLNAGTIGGAGVESSGSGSIEGGFGAHTCNIGLECWVPTDFVWGATPNQMNAGAPFPQWVGTAKRFASASYDATSPNNVACGATNLDLAGVPVEGLFQYIVNPNQLNPFVPEAIRFGSQVLPPSIATEISFGFSFSAPSLVLTDAIARLPQGAVCVEAWVTAQFDGLVVTTIEVEYETRGIAGLSTISNITTTQDAEGNGDLTAAIVLYRRDSVQVLDKDGNPVTVNDYSFKFVGSGTPINIPTDTQVRLDVTTAVNGLVANRDSEYTGILVLPTLAELPASTTGLENYLLSLIPSYSGEITATDDCTVDFRWTAKATEASADAMQFGAILARFRLPDGSLTDTLPIVLTPFMVAP